MRRLVNIRQRIGRHERAATRAEAAGDTRRTDRYLALFQRALDDYSAESEHQASAAPKQSRAEEFTVESTVDMSDGDLASTYNDLWDDPKAQEAIEHVLNWRDENDRRRDEEIAAFQRRCRDERAAYDEYEQGAAMAGSGLVSQPSTRPARRLSTDQALREEYEAYVWSSYMRAEDECGYLLNRSGREKGVAPESLFTGSVTVANAYASDELKAWWNQNGRLTLSAFRYQQTGRTSDRAAAERARNIDFDVANVV